MPRVTHVKKARKDNPAHGIKKGESYFWWKFRFGGKHYSKVHPKPSQLTQSEFLGTMYDIEERIIVLDQITSAAEMITTVEGIVEELRTLAEEQEEKLSNMPDSLQESDTGQLLQDRADNTNQMADDLEGVDLDADMTEDELDDAGSELAAVSYNGD